LPLEAFSGLAFMGILRTSSSPTIFAEKAIGPILWSGLGRGMLALGYDSKRLVDDEEEKSSHAMA